MVGWLGYNSAICYRIYNELFVMTENTEKKLSPLCRTIEQDGKIIRVEIYQDVDGNWLLEVYDEFNNSTAWEDAFESDQDALFEIEATVREEGIDCLIGPVDSGLV
jgi:hypothetical protein